MCYSGLWHDARQVSSEIETLKRRLRDRAAELDRLCCLEGAPGDAEDRRLLMHKLEALEQVNAREKRELEEKLSKVREGPPLLTSDIIRVCPWGSH
jgi:hypothetical protein